MIKKITFIVLLIFFCTKGYSKSLDYIANYFSSDNVTIGTIIDIFGTDNDSYKIEIKIEDLIKGDSIYQFEIIGYIDNIFTLDSTKKIIWNYPIVNIDSFHIGEKLLIYSKKDSNNNYYVNFFSGTKLTDKVDEEEIVFLKSRKNIREANTNKFISSESLDYPWLTTIVDSSMTIIYDRIILYKDTIKGMTCKINSDNNIATATILVKEDKTFDKISITIKIDKNGFIVNEIYDEFDLRIINFLRRNEPFLPATRDGKIYNAKYKYNIEYK